MHIFSTKNIKAWNSQENLNLKLFIDNKAYSIIMNLNSLLYLLSNFFAKEKHVTSLIVVNCFDQILNAKLLNTLSGHNFSVLILPLNKINASRTASDLQTLSVRLNSVGVYLDYNCVSSEQFVGSVSINNFIKFVIIVYNKCWISVW